MIRHDGHLRTRGKCRKHEPQPIVFYISLVFSNARRVLSRCNAQLRLLYLLSKRGLLGELPDMLIWPRLHVSGYFWIRNLFSVSKISPSTTSTNIRIRCRILRLPVDGSRTRGPFLESPGNFSGPESHSKFSNLAITKLFYSHTLKIKGGSLHTRSFSRILFSVFRYRWSKNGFTGRKVPGAFEKRPPGKKSCGFKHIRIDTWGRDLVSLN